MKFLLGEVSYGEGVSQGGKCQRLGPHERQGLAKGGQASPILYSASVLYVGE